MGTLLLITKFEILLLQAVAKLCVTKKVINMEINNSHRAFHKGAKESGETKSIPQISISSGVCEWRV
jgi:hypothetical protein